MTLPAAATRQAAACSTSTVPQPIKRPSADQGEIVAKARPGPLGGVTPSVGLVRGTCPVSREFRSCGLVNNNLPVRASLLLSILNSDNIRVSGFLVPAIQTRGQS